MTKKKKLWDESQLLQLTSFPPLARNPVWREVASAFHHNKLNNNQQAQIIIGIETLNPKLSSHLMLLMQKLLFPL
jgi:hypothetical protein